MAKEISRRLNMATRTLSVDVEDYFGIVSVHTIPLAGDHCPHCKQVIPGADGSPDIETSIAAILHSVREIGDGLIAKLENVNHPEIQKHVEKAKANRGTA